ncbi:hypothetical protein B0H21DRAFT_161182 [Amylocystis lapponica]|nr:hypothetical protein B0H21DRAFT_161182 [Amylocystis lapponica]
MPVRHLLLISLTIWIAMLVASVDMTAHKTRWAYWIEAASSSRSSSRSRENGTNRDMTREQCRYLVPAAQYPSLGRCRVSSTTETVSFGQPWKAVKIIHPAHLLVLGVDYTSYSGEQLLLIFQPLS